MTLQQNAMKRWTDYAVEAAKLIARGSVNPADWMKQYSVLSRGAAEDLSELIVMLFPARAR